MTVPSTVSSGHNPLPTSTTSALPPPRITAASKEGRGRNDGLKNSIASRRSENRFPRPSRFKYCARSISSYAPRLPTSAICVKCFMSTPVVGARHARDRMQYPCRSPHFPQSVKGMHGPDKCINGRPAQIEGRHQAQHAWIGRVAHKNALAEQVLLQGGGLFPRIQTKQ